MSRQHRTTTKGTAALSSSNGAKVETHRPSAEMCRIELEKLWDNPFTTIHAEGIDGVFTDSKQVDDLLSLLTELNQEAV